MDYEFKQEYIKTVMLGESLKTVLCKPFPNWTLRQSRKDFLSNAIC